MKLYHFTSQRHLYGIRRHGLTVGDVPTDILSNKGRIGVWLTSVGEPRGHGLEGGAADKLRFRLTVNAPENSLLARWAEWAAENVTPETVRKLHATAGAFETWWIYFGVLDRAAIEECVDMQTCAAVEGWGDTATVMDVKPVPPWRRHAWHRKLLKEVAAYLPPRRVISDTPLG
jgi:hypothetical protein